MIRFIDVRGQDHDGRFSFWDTIVSQYVDLNTEQAWDTFQEFEVYCKIYRPDDLERFKRLCPDWAFSEPAEDENENWVAGFVGGDF